MRQKVAVFLTSLLLGAALPPPASAALTPPAIPEIEPGAGIIRDKAAAIALGKALFWDEQAGSDGMACASCHMSAGADNRIRNQLSPGFNDALFTPGGDTTFGSTHSDTGTVQPGYMASGAKADSNYVLQKADFPLHQLVDYKDRNSDLITTTNDVVSSSGSYDTEFNRIKRKGGKAGKESCTKPDATIFHAGKYPARQVEPRNTPTTINAAFFHSNFWDGRANNVFNGVGVFGLRDIQGDPNKRLIILDATYKPQLGYLQIRNASLASQAVGPPLSALEMSCDGRTFPDVGRKLLLSAPLHKQKVATTDSVLGPYANPYGYGLKRQHSYVALIKKAFEPRYWAAPGKFKIVDGKLKKDPKGYTQAEINFSMFWGISIMMYERMLISDQSRFDDWFASCRPTTVPPPPTPGLPISIPNIRCNPVDPTASTVPTDYGLTDAEVKGFALFVGFGNPRVTGNPACGTCHGPFANPTAATGIVFPVTSEAAFISGQITPYTPVERSFVTELGDGIPPLTPPFDAANPQHQLGGGVHDRGFFNVGVTPTHADPGNGGLDPYGNPLSLARMFLLEQTATPGIVNPVVDPPFVITPATATTPTTTAVINRCTTGGLIEPGGTPIFPGCVVVPPPPAPPIPIDASNLVFDASTERELVDGGFKTPPIRNVGLTPPYFHSGNYADLRSVVEFYARGGSRRSMSLEANGVTGDTSGTGLLGKGPPVHPGPDFGTNVDFFVRDIKLDDGIPDGVPAGEVEEFDQIGAIVAFMLTMTDTRVQCDAGPFDHPSLTLRNGHLAMDKNKDKKADDIAFVLPAVGAAGYAKSSGLCLPNGGDLFAPGMQGRLGGPKVAIP
ncbi:MAG: cytochrome c peroxidase [Gammaproteobacteria bacterium]